MNANQTHGGPQVRPSTFAAVSLGFLGGASPLLDGLYDISVWAPIGLVALGAVMVLLIAVEQGPGRLALLAPASLAALGAWQYASREWAESTSQALVEAQRTAVLAAFLALVVAVAGRRRDQLALLGGVGAGVLLAAVWEILRLIAGPVPEDFVSGRLTEPLGYMNGQAAAVLAGFWPAIALAERARSRALAATGAGAASLLLGLALMTQSRAGLAALAASALVVLAVVPGRPLRLAAVLLPALAVAVCAPALLEIYASGNDRRALPEAAVLHRGVLMLVIASAVAAALWAAVGPWLAGVAERVTPERLSPATRSAAFGAAALVLAVVVVAGSGWAGRQVDSFTSLQPVTGSSRFASAGGNRYDYWRVAARQFRRDPLKGVGAGNYDTTYFLERRTIEDVRQPHSIWLQGLAETGLVGFALILLLVFAVLASAGRAFRVARYPGSDRGIFVAALGGFTLWLAHTSVDWLHLLPGVSLCAFAAAAVLLRAGDRPRPPAARSPFPARAVGFAVATLATAAVAAGFLADRAQRRADDALAAGDPAAALRAAGDALKLDGGSLPGRYVAAAAYARTGDYAQARETLESAQALEPSDFVPPALLGDLATRRGDDAQAVRDYGRAAGLNPLDQGLTAALRAARERAGLPR